MVNLELVRGRLERPLAVIFAQHENKAGDVAGAWEGVPDTLAHVQARGNGSTRLFWQKVRWGTSLHQRAWTLLWREGEGYELEEGPERTDEDVRDELLAAVRGDPGASWNKIEDRVAGKAERKRSLRDELLAEGVLVNRGGPGRFLLYAADDPELPTLFETGENG
jgi:hypothetical protein